MQDTISTDLPRTLIDMISSYDYRYYKATINDVCKIDDDDNNVCKIHPHHNKHNYLGTIFSHLLVYIGFNEYTCKISSIEDNDMEYAREEITDSMRFCQLSLDKIPLVEQLKWNSMIIPFSEKITANCAGRIYDKDDLEDDTYVRRGDIELKEECKNPDKFTYIKENMNGITLHDITEAIFSLKLLKPFPNFTDTFEGLPNVKINIDDNNNNTNIIVVFDYSWA